MNNSFQQSTKSLTIVTNEGFLTQRQRYQPIKLPQEWIIKTEYILRYITDKPLRRTVQLQLNKGEYRHKLPRWVFFANQGEFTTGDYKEIMNKASCLSLVSNAILYWNTSRISDIVEGLRNQGETVDDDTLAHISLLPYKHVLPNGTYFNEDELGESRLLLRL